MPPPNWDDDFDFDDLDDQPKKKQTQKKSKPNDDDFFDLDDNTQKLPTINKNTGASRPSQGKRNSAKKNPYAQNLKGRGNIYDDYDQQVYEEVEEPKKEQKKAIKKEVEDEIDFYEEIDEKPKQKSIEKKKDDDEENYEEEFQDQGYGDDFEEIQEPPKKIEPPKKVQKKQSTPKYQPPKPPSRNAKPKLQVGKRNQTLNKPVNKPSLPRSNSRQSLKSQESRSRRNVVSRSVKGNKFATNTSFIPNKHQSEIEKLFPHQNLDEMNQDKVSKLNDKVRGMIKKFNDELNDLINRNLLHLKGKKGQKQMTVEGRLRILEEEKKNNETMIEYMEKQYQKLTGREGELKEEEYQLVMEKKIIQAKQQIKDTQKMITRLKVQVNSEGNKLSKKSQQKKIAQELHHLKTTLIQAKKDDQKGGQKVQKLNQQIQDLNSKISDADYELKEVIDKARDKGVKLQSREELIKKFQDIKRKLQISKTHRTKLQSLMKTKHERLSQQKQHLKQTVHNCELEIKNIYDSIGHERSQSVKVVEKAKTNPKIHPNLGGQLEKILQTLEQNQQYDNFSVRSDSQSQSSQRPLKNIPLGNMQKSQPLKTEKKDYSKKIDSEEIKIEKPNLMKKKKDLQTEQKRNEVYERVWKQEQKIEQKQEPKKEQQDKKKPFSLKKNRFGSQNKLKGNNESKNDISEKNIEIEIEKKEEPKQKEEEKKKQQISLAAPKMMKFKRRNQGNEEEKEKEEPKKNKEQDLNLNLKIDEQKPKNQEQEKPAFVPKRFNLRNRAQKKEESYLPTTEKIEKKVDSPIQQNKKEEKSQEYKPNFNFGKVQDNYKKPEEKIDYFKKQQSNNKFTIPSLEQEKVQEKKEQQFKPKFNLRLRDRKKNEDNNSGYLPTGNKEKSEEKKQFTLNTKKQTQESPYKPPIIEKQEVSNPYAPKQNKSNPYAPKQNIQNPYNPYTGGNNEVPQRQREGRLKKPQKVKQTGTSKQKINYFDQAEEVEGLNQFVKDQPVQEQKKKQEKEKDVDLNDLLGINKKTENKGNSDFDDILGGNQKKAKKKNDFFDELDI